MRPFVVLQLSVNVPSTSIVIGSTSASLARPGPYCAWITKPLPAGRWSLYRGSTSAGGSVRTDLPSWVWCTDFAIVCNSPGLASWQDTKGSRAVKLQHVTPAAKQLRLYLFYMSGTLPKILLEEVIPLKNQDLKTTSQPTRFLTVDLWAALIAPLPLRTSPCPLPFPKCFLPSAALASHLMPLIRDLPHSPVSLKPMAPSPRSLPCAVIVCVPASTLDRKPLECRNAALYLPCTVLGAR